MNHTTHRSARATRPLLTLVSGDGCAPGPAAPAVAVPGAASLDMDFSGSHIVMVALRTLVDPVQASAGDVLAFEVKRRIVTVLRWMDRGDGRIATQQLHGFTWGGLHDLRGAGLLEPATPRDANTLAWHIGREWATEQTREPRCTALECGQ